ncbi:MAG TPA: response regulator [Gemmatimonadaceae bacterium]|nr:response regulator [Gemmatimonadaceae bacterium]
MVEDDEACRRRMIKLLTRAHYVTVEAASGSDGYEFFLSNRTLVGCVVLDLIMLGTDGRTLFRMLRERAPDLPVLLTTGTPPDADGYGRLLDARSALLTKPFLANDLVEAVDRLVDRRAG